MCVHAGLVPDADACEQKVSRSLWTALSTKFPGLRPARAADHGGDGCIAVGAGGFDGDGRRDIALLLTDPNQGAVRLAVALRRAPGWSISLLPTWCEGISTCYVRAVKPGLYRRSGALDSPLEPDERDRIQSSTQAVISGTIETTAIVYAYLKGKWHYVWVLD